MLQVRQYTTEGLERSREGLREAASQRERFVLGRKVTSGPAPVVISLYLLLIQTYYLYQKVDHCNELHSHDKPNLACRQMVRLRLVKAVLGLSWLLYKVVEAVWL